MNKTLRTLVSSIIAFLISLNVFSTSSFTIDTLSIQEKMDKVPGKYKKEAYLLGSYVNKEFKDEPSKAFAICYWIASNIDYDFKSYVERRIESSSPNEILKKKKALCGEFANLFKVVCDSAYLDAIVIDGYTKDFDYVPGDTLFRAEHTWSAVKINNEWQLVDLTFATGSYIPNESSGEIDLTLDLLPYSTNTKFIKKFNYKWIFVHPTKMILSHYPAYTELQLLDTPISLKVFRNGKEAISNRLKKNPKLKTNNKELNTFCKQPIINKYFLIGDEGLKNNPYDRRIKGLAYLNAIENIFESNIDPIKNIFTGVSKSTLLQYKRYIKTADSAMKISLTDNELEYRQIQKRSENWKASLKLTNKDHRAVLKQRLRANNNNLKLIDKIYQKGIMITEHLNAQKAQYLAKSLENVNRPKREDPVLVAQSKALMKHQDSIRKLTLGMLFKIENINRQFSKDEVTKRCEQEKKALKIHTDNINNLEKIAKISSNNSFLVHIPTTNVEKAWMKEQNHIADSINKTNIDTLLINLYNSELQLYILIKQYTALVKERLNTLKQAKKNSIADQSEDRIFTETIDNYADNLLSYHFELKTYTLTKELLEENIKSENKKIIAVTDKLQKESDMENDRHKNYLLYRKGIKNAENLRTKMAIKRLIKLNTIVDKSLILVK